MSALDQWYNTNPVWGAVSDWATKNKDNPTATAAANDLFVGAARSSIQRDSDVTYARNMISPMLDLQRGQQGIATEANLKDVAARGAVTHDLERIKGDNLRNVAGIETRSAERRTGLETEAQKYGADRGLEGTKYNADASLAGIRDRGSEDRKTLTQGTDETLRLRADARGAIQDRGRKWFG